MFARRRAGGSPVVADGFRFLRRSDIKRMAACHEDLARIIHEDSPRSHGGHGEKRNWMAVEDSALFADVVASTWSDSMQSLYLSFPSVISVTPW